MGKEMKTTTPLRRLVAGVGALALALSGAAAMGTNAFADTNVGPDQPGNPRKGSLTIHKVEGEQDDTPSDGTVQDMAGRTLLNGVEFTIWQLGLEVEGQCAAIDLADTDAWTEQIPTSTAPATIEGVQAEGFCLVDPVAGTPGTTAGEGSLTFQNLDLGLYYVQETDVAGATDAATGDAVTVVSHAAPFYVTIPLPNDGDWVYDVHAYPKNQTLDAPVKTINDDADQEGLRIGDTVEFTITQTVPALDDGDTYDSASIWDNMGTSFEYDETVAVTLNGTPLVEGTGYALNYVDPLVTWELTGALAGLEAGNVLEVVFTATVLEVTETGEIDNPGSTDPEKPGYGSKFNGTPGPEGPTPYTYWGKLEVTKVDQDGAALAGAEFQVYPRAGDVCLADVPNEDPVSTGISGDDGVVVWDFTDPASSPLGLFVANSSAGQLSSPEKMYCLYETHVPAGYTGVGVQTLTIGAGSELVMDVNDLTIENVQKGGPDLPLTGGAGTVGLMSGGILLLGAGVAVMMSARRRRLMEI